MSMNTKILCIRRLLTISAVGVFALAPLAAPAQSSPLTGTMAVTATLVNGCTAVTAAAMAFGTGLASGSTPTATANVTTTCSAGVLETLSFNNGANAAVNVPQLLPPSGAVTLGYNLYKTATYTLPLTGAAVPPNTIALTGTGSAVATPVYAKFVAAIPVDTLPGAYTDTITVTLAF